MRTASKNKNSSENISPPDNSNRTSPPQQDDQADKTKLPPPEKISLKIDATYWIKIMARKSA